MNAPVGGRSASAGGTPVRVGRISFVNCFPLYLHFGEELAARGFSAEIVEGTPADLNRLLVAGEIDVALPSSIEFARHAGRLALLPVLSISSLGAVDSIQLFGRLPRDELRSVAFSEKSATSVTLFKVLCREWAIDPEMAPHTGPLAASLAHYDGLLLIGDEALTVLRAEIYPHHYDLGEEWRTVTGLPMVYAVLAARREFVEEREEAAAAVAAALVASKDRCAVHAGATAAAAARRYDFSEDYLLHYFDQLKFGFGPEFRRGLAEFYRRAHEVGELEVVPDLELAPPPAPSPRA